MIASLGDLEFDAHAYFMGTCSVFAQVCHLCFLNITYYLNSKDQMSFYKKNFLIKPKLRRRGNPNIP